MRPNKPAQTERSHPLRMPKGWEPPVPAWSSTFKDEQPGVSMAVVGFQHESDRDVTTELKSLQAALKGAEIRDLLSCDAGGGLRETVCIAYWSDPDAAGKTMASEVFTSFWDAQTAGGDFGLIKECVNIPMERTETLFSGPLHDHGYSQMRKDVAGPIRHHQYWGGMRDRIPLSASDALDASSPVRVVERNGETVVVEAHENLCIIRSGQDWSKCEVDQLAEYVDLIEPVLNAGMTFLRDQGDQVNCYSCRYLKDIDPDGGATKRSSGLAYFRTMADLEGWAEHHPTHLKIFNTFLTIAPKHGPNLQLRLWHEVSVLPAEGCRAEYVRCRPGTGWMLI